MAEEILESEGSGDLYLDGRALKPDSSRKLDTSQRGRRLGGQLDKDGQVQTNRWADYREDPPRREEPATERGARREAPGFCLATHRCPLTRGQGQRPA
ncbi:hypothetical protein DPEC_G00273160 [Dallia pectoralis]|uniref:Uncharacterized protein n=1 Tax=Dallia pectoralis TaxID=75939 RepID=A0ACC2FQJ3_DALPE|nr:hypothetical protein DPEC_G00273160 [Dallia pectoralis]